VKQVKLVYLPVNAAWAFLFGDTLVRLHNADSLFFRTRRAAVLAASACGLAVGGRGAVSVREG
jgi:hypothetical protein